MKIVLFIFSSVVFLFSCNNDEGGQQPAANNAVTPDLQMQNLIKKFPDSLLLRDSLIKYYRDNGKYDNAITEVNNALARDSNNAVLWDMKATLHIEIEDTAGCIKAYEKAVSLSPMPDYLMSLGSIYAFTKNPKAIPVANQLIAQSNGKATKEALFIKGLYLSNTNNKQQAIGFFSQCLLLDYNFLFAYREKAIALYDMGNYDEAIAVLKTALKLHSDYDEAYYWTARCLEKQNKKVEAVANYKMAIQLSPDYEQAIKALETIGAQ
jgi:tetratricopeptide (TPR) repeat protein